MTVKSKRSTCVWTISLSQFSISVTSSEFFGSLFSVYITGLDWYLQMKLSLAFARNEIFDLLIGLFEGFSRSENDFLFHSAINDCLFISTIRLLHSEVGRSFLLVILAKRQTE